MAGRVLSLSGGRAAGGGGSLGRTLDPARQLVRHLQDEARAFDRAIEAGMRESGTGLKNEMRRQVRRAYAGRRLAGAIRARFYEKGRAAVAFVYSREKRILALGETGGTVRPKTGQFLAIPHRAVLAGAGGARSRGRAPRVEDYIGKKNVFFIAIKGGRELLLVRGTRSRTTILFHLARQTEHRKRLDFDRAARSAADDLPGDIVDRLPG